MSTAHFFNLLGTKVVVEVEVVEVEVVVEVVGVVEVGVGVGVVTIVAELPGNLCEKENRGNFPTHAVGVS